MSYFVEFQPQEINLVWNVLLEGKVSGRDAPVMTAVLQNMQRAVEEQDAAEMQKDREQPEFQNVEETSVESPEIEVEKSE